MKYRVAAWFIMVILAGSCGLNAAEPVSTVRWAATALGAASGAADVKLADEMPRLVLKRQDHGELGLSRSVMGNRIKIGTATFDHGLGTHSTSEIDVKLPAHGAAKRFSAMVGIDNNDNTAGHLGTVEFSVEIGGKEVWKSGIKRGGEEATAVDVEIPADAGEIVLKVGDGGDGPAFDHSDWANATLAMADGHALLLDTLPPPTFWPAAKAIPFSFVYDGKSSSELLAAWKHEAKSEENSDGATSVATWTDEATGLRVTATAKAYKDFAAVEWLLRFENTGKADSPILENVQALDALLPAATARHIVLDQIKGDDASPDSFVPMERDLKVSDVVPLAPNGGRPSNGTFPFFDIENDSEHVFVAIGWTGQWAAALARDASGVHVKAGMELTHLKLHPGESIRSPRILLLSARGDRMDAHNQFRRLLLAHYVPRVKNGVNGELPKFAVAAQTFNMVFGAGIRPEWATEAGQIAAAKINKAIGCDTLWMDAGWFDGNFPNGVGNWTVKKKEFPNGLGPVGEFCKQIGLEFLVWYEPERVAPGTRIATTDEQSVLTAGQPKANGGLLNLSDDATAKKMTDMILRQMDEGGITHYRNDFNIDPLPYWRANDAPDRQGMTEIRYVENFYRMWDAIRAKRPGTIPDDCASGGRRIDLEMVMRSIVQTRTDAAVAPGRSDWHQSETYGLSLFLPLHATIGWETDAYATRSVGLAGVCFEWDILDPKFPAELAKAGIEEIKANQKYWSGDFYPLTPWSFGTQQWMAWQLDRPDLGEGLIMAFRREDCPYTGLQVALRGIKVDAQYHVELIDQERHVENKTMSGKDLAAMELQLPKRGSVIVRYAEIRAGK